MGTTMPRRKEIQEGTCNGRDSHTQMAAKEHDLVSRISNLEKRVEEIESKTNMALKALEKEKDEYKKRLLSLDKVLARYAVQSNKFNMENAPNRSISSLTSQDKEIEDVESTDLNQGRMDWDPPPSQTFP